MDLKNCTMCGKIFVYYGNKICRNCNNKLEEAFLKVRDYLTENPDADLIRICDETGVEEKIVLQMIREGRIELVRDDPRLACRACGTAIRKGHYCDKCAASMSKSFKKILKDNDESKLYHVENRLRTKRE